MDRLAVKWLEKGPHGRLLDMSDDEFATWNPEGRAGHLYMLRGAVGRDVRGESRRYQGSNGTSYLTMVFQTQQALDRQNGLNDWNGLDSKTMAWASALGLQLGIHFTRDCKVEKSVQRWSFLNVGAFQNHVEGG